MSELTLNSQYSLLSIQNNGKKTVFEYSKAYIIGVANYQHAPWLLSKPLEDVKMIEATFRQHHFETETLCDPDLTTLQGFLDSIKADNLNNEEGRVIIYYAGHGIQRDSLKGLKGYLVPTDAEPQKESSMYEMEKLQELINQIPTRHILLILDCCFAGAFNFISTRDTADFNPNEKMSKQYFSMYTQFKSRKVLTSTSSRQKAFDFIEFKDKNSPFVEALVRGLSGDADLNKDGIITISELAAWLQNEIPLKTRIAGNQQTVGLGALEDDGDGEFIFSNQDLESILLEEFHYENPYKGLNSYEPNDAPVFFGRKEAIRQLFDKFCNVALTVVTGASGTGKSSLVKAGLVPKLLSANLIKSLEQPALIIIRPGKNPTQALPQHNDWEVLIIDQLEEIITQSRDEVEITQFYQKIRDWLSIGKKIIVIIRTDFEMQVRQEFIEEYWLKGRFLVPLFSLEDYKEIITLPARRAACLFEPPGLVNEIIKEVNGEPGPLPLLSFLLESLFEKAKQKTSKIRTISQPDYEHLGGLSGALTTRAESVYLQLATIQHGQEMIRHILLRMTFLSMGEIAKKRVFLEDLFFGSDEEGLVDQIIQLLSKERLILHSSMDFESSNSTSLSKNKLKYIEPAHDALVRSWKRLHQWIKELTEENLLACLKLIEAADEDILLPDDPRVEIGLKLHHHKKQLFKFTAKELTFLEKCRQVSLDRIKALEDERDEAKRQKAVAEKQARANYNIAVYTTTKETDPTAAYWMLAYHKLKHASKIDQIFEFRLLNKEQFGFIHKKLHSRRIPNDVQQMAVSPSQKQIIAICSRSKLMLWNLEEKKEVGTFIHDSGIFKFKFSLNGDKILSVTKEKFIYIWDIVSMAQQPLLSYGLPVQPPLSVVEISADLSMISTVAKDENLVNLWNTRDGSHHNSIPVNTTRITALAFSFDLKKIAISFWSNPKNIIELWNVTKPKKIMQLNHEHYDGVNRIIFSADGQYILSGGTGLDRSVVLSDGKTGQTLQRFVGLTDSVLELAFSPDNESFFIGGSHGSVTEWDLKSGKKTMNFIYHQNPVNSIGFISTENALITCGDNGEIIQWIKLGMGKNNEIYAYALEELRKIYGFKLEPDDLFELICQNRLYPDRMELDELNSIIGKQVKSEDEAMEIIADRKMKRFLEKHALSKDSNSPKE